jgi:hypothetical protein
MGPIEYIFLVLLFIFIAALFWVMGNKLDQIEKKIDAILESTQ